MTGAGPIPPDPASAADRRTRVRLLAALLHARGQPVSGADLAARLGLSRTAIWKHVEALRHDGMPVEARPRRGYSLAPEDLERAAAARFFPELLEAERLDRRLGHAVHWEPEAGSTNDLARRMAETGAAEGTVVIADRQTAGRGRMRRFWWSPPGGLWMSVILRPRLLPAQLPVLTLAVAVAVAEAVEIVAGRPVGLKWPNDVEIDGRKVAGILLEMVAQADGAEYVIAGIGVNLEVRADSIPDELRDRVTWLAREAAEPVTRNRLAAAILERLEDHYVALHAAGPDPVLAAWRARATVLGEQVRVVLPTGEVTGIAIDVDRDGALILDVPGAGRQRVLAGDVQRVRTV
ncbi:MAG TPA: biotin--[acetyl-CoA-carboxylase] ligase [Thermaerobacter sp.]